MDEAKITKQELMRILSRLSNCSPAEQEEMANTFSEYDREIQEEFLRNLGPALNISE
jgi:Ca2+-binding EF-hand superfamily protein